MLGSSWTSGINLYMTIAGLGIAQRFHWISLPGDMKVLANPFIIIIALLVYIIEFVADKIPVVDNIWDSVHTFIRPVGGAVLGYMGMSTMGPAVQIPVALITGAVSLDSHLTKATTRVAVNSSAIPFANVAASVTEDVAVAGTLVLIAKHPVITALIVVLLIALSVWFLRKMFRFLKKVLKFMFAPSTSSEA